MTHSAVSQQIRHLEDWFGFPLFERHASGVRLTRAGRSLQQSAREAFDLIESCCDELRHHQEPRSLVLGAPASFLSNWLIPRLEHFELSKPDIQVTLQTANDPVSLTNKRVDALILTDRTLPSSIVSVPLFAETIGPVCTLRWARKINQPSDVLSLPLLHTTSQPSAWREWGQANGLDHSHFSSGRQFDHLGHMLEAAASGLGVAIAPQMLIDGDIARGRLVAPVGFVTSGASFSFCHRKGDVDPTIAAFQDWLLAERSKTASSSADH